MAKKKKVSRKELLKKPDEFITFSGKLIQFGTAHRQKLLVGAGAVFAILLIIIGIRYYSYRMENKAFSALSQGIATYSAAMKAQGQDQAFLKVKDDFEKLIKRYSSRQGGRMARLFWAETCYDNGHYDEALTLYQAALKDFKSNPVVKNLVLNGLGYTYEGKKDYEQALSYFRSITEGSESLLKEDAYFNIGRLQAQLGNQQASRDAFQKIVSSYPDALYLELARERIQTGA